MFLLRCVRLGGLCSVQFILTNYNFLVSHMRCSLQKLSGYSLSR